MLVFGGQTCMAPHSCRWIWYTW